jgi:hypothetical protein
MEKVLQILVEKYWPKKKTVSGKCSKSGFLD